MIKSKKGNSEPREQIEAGLHVARCFQMIEIGTVDWEYKGQPKSTPKVRLSFELPNEMRTFDEDKGEQPMVIDKEYSLYMVNKANLRKDLEAWRGKAFTEQEADDFDITNLLGIPCMLTIQHRTAKNGNDYANIVAIAPLMKGMECPKQINPTIEFNYSDKFDTEFVASLPDFIKNVMRETPEYKDRVGALHSIEEEKKMDATMDKIIGSEDSNDLPFIITILLSVGSIASMLV